MINPRFTDTYLIGLCSNRTGTSFDERAERTKLDFRCPICHSAIGQASCFICACHRQLMFPFCCTPHYYGQLALFLGK